MTSVMIKLTITVTYLITGAITLVMASTGLVQNFQKPQFQYRLYVKMQKYSFFIKKEYTL